MSYILVVDDDPDMRALIGAYLTAAGHEVDFAADGVAATEHLWRRVPDLVVTDFQMPRMDGFSLFNAIRAQKSASRVPVVMVTAHNSRDMMQKALGLGIDDFLGKPITQADLVRVVTERLKPVAPGQRTDAVPAAAPSKAEFFGSVMCCHIGRLEAFALALKKEELDQLLDKFASEALIAVHPDGGVLSRPGFHHLIAVFEESSGKAHALRALHSGLRMVLAAQRMKPWVASRFAGRDLPDFLVAIGVHSGNVKSTGAGEPWSGEAVDMATFLAGEIPKLRWSIAASRAAAKAAGFAFLAGRGAQLREPKTGGTLKAVEVRGLGMPDDPTPQSTRAATLIEAAVERNANLAAFAGVALKPVSVQPPPAATPKAAPQKAAPSKSAPKRYDKLRQLSDNGVVAVHLVGSGPGQPQHVLKTILINDDKKQAKRPHLQKFVDQYAAIGSISHPNIAKVVDQGLTATHLYVVQEYCPGGDLRNLIAEKMVVDDALKALVRIVGALRVAHQRGFIHGDLKPANVMVRADGSLALVDFTLARLIEYAAGEGESGVMLRSPDYLSPEIINNQPPDAQSDIYMLGLLLHEMLTGQRAYASPDLSKVMMDHLTGKTPALPAGYEKFQLLLDKLMAKDRAERFASMADVMAFMAQAKLA